MRCAVGRELFLWQARHTFLLWSGRYDINVRTFFAKSIAAQNLDHVGIDSVLLCCTRVLYFAWKLFRQMNLASRFDVSRDLLPYRYFVNKNVRMFLPADQNLDHLGIDTVCGIRSAYGGGASATEGDLWGVCWG